MFQNANDNFKGTCQVVQLVECTVDLLTMKREIRAKYCPANIGNIINIKEAGTKTEVRRDRSDTEQWERERPNTSNDRFFSADL